MKSFFIISGVVLIVSGSLQVLVRPRVPGETRTARLLNRAAIRALVFVLAGGLAILVGSGRLPLPTPP